MATPPAPDVPVFDCRIIVTHPDRAGVVRGRMANLEGIEASGTNEREVLRAIVSQFKEYAMSMIQCGEELPWKAPESPGEDESLRWVPVHL